MASLTAPPPAAAAAAAAAPAPPGTMVHPAGPYFVRGNTASTIACCLCGAATRYNKAALCPTCLRNEVDIAEGIDREQSVHWCRGCERFLRPPWVHCELESPELLAVCLRNIKGLDRVKLVDANWVWTEPHSRRLKLRLTIQKEALGVVVQQDLVVELKMQNHFCDDCHRGEAKFSATSTVQVRQHVSHKRTFLFLEQMIIRHQAHRKISGFAPSKTGLDFEFARPQEAAKFVDFVRTIVPVKTSVSKKLVGENRSSNLTNYRFKHAVTIAPVCRHDLVLLPKGMARAHGNIARLVICAKVSASLTFLDPLTGQEAVVTSKQYFKQKNLDTLFSTPLLTEYLVLDCTPVEAPKTTEKKQTLSGSPTRKKKKKKKKGKGRKNTASAMHAAEEAAGARSGGGGGGGGGGGSGSAVSPAPPVRMLGDIEVARVADLGVNDERFLVRSHLGAFLRAGDTVMGYDLENSNMNVDVDLDELPDVVLVRKKRPPRRRKGGKKNDKKKQKKAQQQAGGAGGGGEVPDDVSEAGTERAPALPELPRLAAGVDIGEEGDMAEFLEELDEDGLLAPLAAAAAAAEEERVARLAAQQNGQEEGEGEEEEEEENGGGSRASGSMEPGSL